MPSCPPPLSPQQYAWPAVVSAQVYPSWDPPAVICSNASPPVTATGAARSVVLPSPSCPRLLDPQQYAAPWAVRPQVCSTPVLREANVSPPVTATGANRWVVVLSPSWPA